MRVYISINYLQYSNSYLGNIPELCTFLAIIHYIDFYIAPSMSVIGWLNIYVHTYRCMYLYQTFLTNFRALYLTQFLTDFGQILDSKSYDQA